MEIQKQKLISIAFLDEETDVIKSIFNKLIREAIKAGYTKLYTKDERELIMKINDEINDTF